MKKAVIVGRPNVGKSSLLNALCGNRVSIVDQVEGVTRDRISVFVTIDKRGFELIDTGGIGIVDEKVLERKVEEQIDIALLDADLVLFVVDAITGTAADDKDIGRKLRKLDRPVMLVVNKVDNKKLENAVPDFSSMGFANQCAVSVKNKINLKSIKEWLRSQSDEEDMVDDTARPIKFAFVGRRNVGKSSIVNTLARQERVIVSEIPGTTRDSVDVLFKKGKQEFIAIDTAGLRKRGKYSTSVEYFSYLRTHKAIQRCDLAVLVLDAEEGIGKVDKKIADTIEQEGKPCIIAVNKWDLAKKHHTTVGEYLEYIEDKLPGLSYAPVTCISAVSGLALTKMVHLGEELYEQSCRRVSTSRLNKVLQEAIKQKAPPALDGRRPKILYGTQVSVCPPHIVVFVNNKQLFRNNYTRYLKNTFRQHLGYPEVPLVIDLRGKPK